VGWAVQRLGQPPLGDRTRPGPVGALLGLLLAVGQPLGQPDAGASGCRLVCGGAPLGDQLP
jgi:hypothetical protein